MTTVLKLVDPDKPAPPGTVVIRLASGRSVWFALVLAAALVVLGLIPSTFIESSEASPYQRYRIEWTCPTFGESTSRVSANGGSVPARRLAKPPCADEARLRRVTVLVGLPATLACAALLTVGLTRAKRRTPEATMAGIRDLSASDTLPDEPGDKPGEEGDEPGDGL